jgi:hypothetical protein
MAWSPDSKTLVTAAFKSLYIWDVKVITVFFDSEYIN